MTAENINLVDAPVPCGELRTAFYSQIVCVNCGVLSELHTPEGWCAYFRRQAEACDGSANGHQQRADELRAAAFRARTIADAFPLTSLISREGTDGR